MLAPWQVPVERIDTILRRQYQGTPVQKALDAARLRLEWPSVVGEMWGRHAEPMRLQNGVLWLQVADSSWAQRFAFEQRRLQDRVEAWLGMPVQVRLRVGPAPVPEAPRTNTPVLADDPAVTNAVAGMPRGVLRETMHTFLGRLAAFQQTSGDKENNP